MRLVYDIARRVLPPKVKERLTYPRILDWPDYVLNKRSIHVFPDIEGMVSPDEREYLYLLAKGLDRASNIVEIGCLQGLSTYFLGMGAKVSGSHVYSIDPFTSNLPRQLEESDTKAYFKKPKPSLDNVMMVMKRYGLQDTVTLIEGFSHEVARDWVNPIMLLSIDGNHKHEEVLRDYQDWSKFIQQNGFILFHDSNPPRQGLESVAGVIRKVVVPPDWKITKKLDATTVARRMTPQISVPLALLDKP